MAGTILEINQLECFIFIAEGMRTIILFVCCKYIFLFLSLKAGCCVQNIPCVLILESFAAVNEFTQNKRIRSLLFYAILN